VPYYRDLFASGASTRRPCRALMDLQALPLLTKADIRTQGDRLRADNARGLARFNTGGSSAASR
jgi:phenylacetate-CoA ligase